MPMPYITGYADPLSVKPGETIRFMLSAEGANTAEAAIVRLVHGDEHPEGPGFVEQEVATDIVREVALEHQPTQVGSFLEIEDPQARLALAGDFTLHAWIWPTRTAAGPQALLSRYDAAARTGYALTINADGCLAFLSGDGKVAAEVALDLPLTERVWYFVAAAFDAASGRVRLYQRAVVNAWNSRLAPLVERRYDASGSFPVVAVPAVSDTGFLVAGRYDTAAPAGCRVGQCFDGKIDRPGIVAAALDEDALTRFAAGERPGEHAVIAFWDTTAGYRDDGIDDVVYDVGPHALHGHGRNRPIRAMTGYNWRGRDDCFRLDPSQYGGVYFHADAITDCAWRPSVTWRVPEDLRSGVYALRLRGNRLEDHVTFFVRPLQATAKVAMLMPTASYLAYANERFVLDGPMVAVVTGHTLMLSDSDYLLGQHPEFGSSTYDHYADGDGVCYSSSRRPILNLRPRHRMAATGVPWQFPADLSIIWWLEQAGFDYDVITDTDLDGEGLALLEPYSVVINGTHSEYYSERMMDATDAYIAGGGRVMYLGANGYYWVVGFRPQEPWCMEVRKLNAGSRAWQAAPGEHYMASDGNRGGLWRDRGRPPQKSMGVGFTSEGMDECKPYRRLPDSHDPRVAWALDGVGEVFGDNGLALGGAAGLELDRYDLAWGTPPDTFLLAASEGHSDNYPHVGEEVLFNFPGLGGTQDFQVRGDVTLFAARNGGAVFSTGSIAWGQALPWNGGDNDIARVTRNVLTAFLERKQLF